MLLLGPFTRNETRGHNESFEINVIDRPKKLPFGDFLLKWRLSSFTEIVHREKIYWEQVLDPSKVSFTTLISSGWIQTPVCIIFFHALIYFRFWEYCLLSAVWLDMKMSVSFNYIVCLFIFKSKSFEKILFVEFILF